MLTLYITHYFLNVLVICRTGEHIDIDKYLTFLWRASRTHDVDGVQNPWIFLPVHFVLFNHSTYAIELGKNWIIRQEILITNKLKDGRREDDNEQFDGC